MKRTEVDMTRGALLPMIIKFTVPVILSQLLTMGFSMADMIVVGRFGQVGSVGAIGATSTMINLIIVLFLGISTGAGVATARAIGERIGKKSGIPSARRCRRRLSAAR